MRLFQYSDKNGHRAVGVTADGQATARKLLNCASVRELALSAHRNGRCLRAEVDTLGYGEALSVAAIIDAGQMLLPLDHPDPAHCVIAITGLTHLGSAESRDAMHARLNAADLSDSMKMFKLGVEGGKPKPGRIGAQPEWAYKGDGDWAVPPERPIALPAYADDGGEEAEITGLYVIADNGSVLRVGYCLGNEFSDHMMERKNYLYLAHSKLRQCSYGPEILIGDLPGNITGQVEIIRNSDVVWKSEFISGENNMCHSIANLEHHHFKYPGFRRPGDVHVYFYGASVLSFTDGFTAQAGDVSVVHAEPFGAPLRNPLITESDAGPLTVAKM